MTPTVISTLFPFPCAPCPCIHPALPPTFREEENQAEAGHVEAQLPLQLLWSCD